MKQISVIIPTFNRALFLERAVLSVVKQRDFYGEIIIVDDGSTDTTERVVKDLCEKYNKVMHYIYQENKGPAAARNRGLRDAQYDLIAFLDSDDHWIQGKLSKQAAWMEKHPSFYICHTQEKWLRRGEHLNQKKKHQPRQGDIFSHCLQLCAVGMSTVMVKKEIFSLVGVFDESLPCCEDYDFWLRVSARFPFLLLETPLTIKEGGRDDQVSFQYRVGMDKYRIDAMQNLLVSVILSKDQKALALNELRKKCRVYGKGCIKHGKFEEGEKYISIMEGNCE